MVNNLTGFGSTLKSNGFSDKFLMKLYKISYKKSKCVFFQNESNLKFDLDHKLVTGPYKLVPGSGVNTERYPLQPYPDEDIIVFNYLGRVMHDKGIDDYIECARRIKKNHPNTEFNVIGFIEPTEIHYQEDLKKLEEEGIIIYRGQQMDVRPFIARAHAIIHPSMYGEGMSNVLLENASSGRPVITTDNPGCRETLNDGVTGFMYHGGNVDELVEKVEQFLSMSNEERKKMGEKGREKVSREFSRDTVVRTYLDKFAEILSE
ncbi:Glycosyltransferase Gtf1 [bioreactor metagenome]|uniref:Glycosyltransferase Gtf1 n=1 Tax=bioreactor metagenome TaxID=1076179 RepID=A0A645FN05_9ZZZZ